MKKIASFYCKINRRATAGPGNSESGAGDDEQHPGG